MYIMWVYTRNGTLKMISALLAWSIRINICGNRGYGYFARFLTAAFFLLMSFLSLPVFKFKYESDRVINWKEVRSVVFSSHNIFMFVLMFYFGLCVAFQAFLGILVLGWTRSWSFGLGHDFIDSKINACCQYLCSSQRIS